MEKRKSPEKVMDLGELKKVIFLSYMFSQGYKLLQTNLLQIVSSYYTEIIPVDDNQKRELNQYIWAVFERLKNSKTHGNFKLPSDDNPVEFYDILVKENKELRLRNLAQRERINIFLDMFIQRDYRFMIGKRNNRNEENTGDNSLNDKSMSFAVNYLIRKQKTGNYAYDKMLETTRGYLNSWLHQANHNKLNGPDNRTKFMRLVHLYNSLHKETPVIDKELRNLGLQLPPIDRFGEAFDNL